MDGGTPGACATFKPRSRCDRVSRPNVPASFAKTIARIPLPLTTARLTLRPGRLSDAPRVTHLLQDELVARPLGGLPDPYRLGHALEFIRAKRAQRARGESLQLFLTGRVDAELVGAIELNQLHAADRHGYIGYWLGRPYWGRGLMTEAARAVVAVGFHDLALHRIESSALATNDRSLRVLNKVGFRAEGVARKHRRIGRRWVDEVRLGLLAPEFEALQPGT